MKLASLYLDDIVVIPAGKKLGTDQPRADLREQSFHASEGWDIHRIAHRHYTVFCEGMPRVVNIEGYAGTYDELPEPPAKKGKR
jgi:ABC-type hemin transport system ATPase subunit